MTMINPNRHFLLRLRGILAAALFTLPLAALAQLTPQAIGWESCDAGAPVQSLTCAGIAEVSTAGGDAVAVDFEGRFGTSGSTALFSDSGALTIRFSATVSRVSLDLLQPAAGSSARAFDGAANEIDAVVLGAAANVASAVLEAPGIARVVIDDPQGEFGIDQLQFDPEQAVPGCPVASDGCFDVCSIDYAVGGVVNGLAGGTQLTLQNNGGDDLVLNADGPFEFATLLPHQSVYAVTVAQQPANPDQVCSVSNASGSIDGADVSDVAVECLTLRTIGGTVSGLAPGNSVTLQNNGGDDLVVPEDGNFAFATRGFDGEGFEVTVLSQPTTPGQICSVTGGSGVLSGDTSIDVVCTTLTYTVGGSISGLASGNSVILQNNGGDNLAVAANGAFTFATPVADGAPYAVTVATQPDTPNQTCSVANGSGVIAGAAVADVLVTCSTDTFSVGGSVTGLAAGNSVTLRNNGGDDLLIGADGAFTFASPVADGEAYVVTVAVQPGNPDQTCTVANGSGLMSGAAVVDVAVTCSTDTFSVGGSVSGLAAGNSVTLRNNGGDDLLVGADGAFTFATPVADGESYAVVVATQPETPNQTCNVANGSGVIAGAAVADVLVTCSTDTFSVGGSVTGLAAGNSVTLRNNGGDDLLVGADGAFTFATPVADGEAYLVSVAVQPDTPDQTCTVANGSGLMSGAAVVDVAVTCSTDTFSVGGSVSGLAAGNSVTLRNNGGDDLLVGADGAFTFATPVADGESYAVVVATQPETPNQTCNVANGSGVIAGAAVADVLVTCSTDTFSVGGSVTGLAAGNSVTLRNNGGDDLLIGADGAFTFATPVADGEAYLVSVAVQPDTPDQTCTVANGSGLMSGAAVVDVAVTCSTDTFSVGGSVSGLAAGNSVTLRNNGGDDLVVGADGAFIFASPIADGAAYTVTVSVQPDAPAQTCVVANGSGVISGAAIADVAVTCSTDTFTVGGSVSGLADGNTLTLQNNGVDSLVIAANGAFAFATEVADGGSYAVSVSVQPDAPAQTCSVANGSGVLSGAAVDDVAVTCSTDAFTIGGSVTGLAEGNAVTLQNNGDEELVVAANGSFVFPTSIADGSAYAVTVLVQPSAPAQTCIVERGAGSVAGGDVTDVAVDCALETVVVTPIAGPGGALVPSDPQTVAIGSPVEFEVQADLGYAIDTVSGCDGELQDDIWVIEAAEEDCTVSASFVKQVISGSTPAGLATASVDGAWVFAPPGEGPALSGGFIPASGHPDSPPSLPSGQSFPFGLLDFVLVSGAAGSSAMVSIEFPQAVPEGAQFWLFGPTAADPVPHWHAAQVVVGGQVLHLTVQDGGNGDADLDVNASIATLFGVGTVSGTVPSSPSPVATIPAGSAWSHLLLVVLTLLVAGRVVRGRLG